MPKLCEFETCRKQASYGNSYGKPIRCKEHKEEYKLVSQLCQNGDCCIKPTYNFFGETNPIYCNKHKKDNMVVLNLTVKGYQYIILKIKNLLYFVLIIKMN